MLKLVKVIFSLDSFWGKKNEIKYFKKGFAVWLLKNDIAQLATNKNIQLQEKKQEEKKNEKEKKTKESLKIKDDLEKQVLEFSLKKDTKGFPYGSISFKEVLTELKKKGFTILKSQLISFIPIRKIGEEKIKIKLEEGIKVEVKIIIF